MGNPRSLEDRVKALEFERKVGDVAIAAAVVVFLIIVLFLW